MTGPLSYRNWNENLLAKPWHSMFEYPLFSDSTIVGNDVSLGPYELINNCPIQRGRPSLILRAKDHLSHQYQLSEFKKTEDEYYHGGYEVDEIAALLSLCLGVRLKAGAPSRGFGNGGDPKGRPLDHGVPEDPNLSTIHLHPNHKGLVFPRGVQDSSFEQISIFASFPILSPDQAIALVRAARMYQEAIWIVEVTPELSWLMLVSCVEIIANQWREDSGSPVDSLVASSTGSELIEILHKYGGDQKEELVYEVADKLAKLMGAAKKFKDFIMYFLPPEPPKRPSKFAQHSWKPSKIKQSLDRIYDYRSKALHGGKPFPAPMCQPPLNLDGIPAEIPHELGIGMQGSVWVGKDIPMYLHIFEYIARNAILKWWKAAAKE